MTEVADRPRGESGAREGASGVAGPWHSAICLLTLGGLCLLVFCSAQETLREQDRAIETLRDRCQAMEDQNEAQRDSFGRLQVEAVALADAVAEALEDDVRVDLGQSITPGMNYCDWGGRYGTKASHKMIRELADVGIRKLVLTPTHYQRRADSTEIYEDRQHSREATTPTREQLESDIRLAHELGMEVGLKLHIDPEDETPRGDIELKNEEDYQKWLANYRQVLFEMVDLAKANDVEHFYVGCELSGVVNYPHTDHWRSLIRAVRERFLPKEPKLTFASQHTNTYNIQFWDELDYIGINTWPYFKPSSELSIPALKKKWQSVIFMVPDKQVGFFDYVHFVARTFGRPVVLTEFGCQSKSGAASQPVIWNDGGKAEPLVQAYFYEAFFELLREDMVKFARTHPGEPYPIIGIDSWNCVIGRSGPKDTDYTIVGKPAAMLYRKVFGRPRTGPALDAGR